MSWIEMTARYNGRCCKCINRVYPGQRIFWNNNGSHKVKHTTHDREDRDRSGRIGGGRGPSFSGGIIVGGGDIPTSSLIDISKDSDFQRRKEMRENLRECYN
tara:strand:- start:2221 stop:2526 length:306 start_codon:yes stop_codon:yes gene_type:complete